MGRGKRFKVLETAIKKYKAPTNIAGTPFAIYTKFKAGEADYHPSQPSRGDSEERKLKAFGAPVAEDPYVISGASTRALNTSIASTGLALADLALSNVAAADTVQDNPNFIPAKVVVFVRSGTTSTPVAATANKVTGTAYKRRGGASYTLPFGQGATPGTTVVVAMGYLATKAGAGVGRSTTFKPERFYGNGS